MTFFQALAVLLGFSAAAGYINHRWIKLPPTMGLMVVGILFSMALVFLGKVHLINTQPIIHLVEHLDFSGLLLHGMLAFLLFAGALQVDLSDLKNQKLPIAILSTVGVVLSTGITGVLLWLAARLLSVDLSLLEALLFGALIAPTDPIAVIGLLDRSTISKNLEIKIVGESMFNDGVGVVLFLILLGMVTGTHVPTPSGVIEILLVELGGGLLLGLTLGYLSFLLLRSIDNYQIEVLLTLALSSGGYALAECLHVSAPLTIVISGLIIGNHGRALAMSEKTRSNLDTFWELLDEILNAILFALIGLEMIRFSFQSNYGWVGLMAIGIVLLSRLISVALPILAMRRWHPFSSGSIPILTWGGIRGGISVALALSLPSFPAKDLIVFITYLLVIWSILIQGLTLNWLVSKVTPQINPVQTKPL